MLPRILLLLSIATLAQTSIFNAPSAAIRLSKHWFNFDELPLVESRQQKEDFEKYRREPGQGIPNKEVEYNFKPIEHKFDDDFVELPHKASLHQKNAARDERKYPDIMDALNYQDDLTVVDSEEIEDALEESFAERNANLNLLKVKSEETFDDTKWATEDSDESEEKNDALLPESDEDWEDESRPFLKRTCLKKSGKKFELRAEGEERVWETAAPGWNEFPKAFDWRNVNGTNYCSPNRNQHIPVYCGSCWVFGTTGALNDRFNIARKNRWPMTMVSPQEIIDCNGKGNCQGGEVGNVLEYAHQSGLVEEGCNVYRATNGECNPFHRCGSCWPDHCFPIQNYTRYYVKSYGSVSGREKIMSELMKGGPLACAIGATPKFEFNYTSGVYYEKSNLTSNHIVSLTGWGVDEQGTEYWIVRNSWGDAWGELGWYRTVTSLFMNGTGDDYNMGIERECYWAEVDVSNLN